MMSRRIVRPNRMRQSVHVLATPWMSSASYLNVRSRPRTNTIRSSLSSGFHTADGAREHPINWEFVIALENVPLSIERRSQQDQVVPD